MITESKIRGSIIGQLVGDSLGVPVECANREDLKLYPVTGMSRNTNHKWHSKIDKGRWSDDGSLTLALVHSLVDKDNVDLNDLLDKMLSWLDDGKYTPDGYSFGTGKTTKSALAHYKANRNPFTCGLSAETNNGNGSLMRILPLIFYIKKNTFLNDFPIVRKVSSITHAHLTSVISCVYLINFAFNLLYDDTKEEAYDNLRWHFLSDIRLDLDSEIENIDIIKPFEPLLYKNINELPEEEINSGFFVADTLKASIWCILTTDNFKDAVLKAVNLGGDSDSTGAVTGGLAGLIYGYESIPQEWIKELPINDEINEIINQFVEKYREI